MATFSAAHTASKPTTRLIVDMPFSSMVPHICPNTSNTSRSKLTNYKQHK